MKNKNTNNTKKRLGIWAIVVMAILMIPFLTNAPWTGSDYIFAGVVLFVLATAYELITRNLKNKFHHVLVGGAILLIIVLIIGWAATGP
jgi:uncharacterized membrane protein YfhO